MDSKASIHSEVAADWETRLAVDFTPCSSDTEALKGKCMELWRIIDEDPELNWWSAVSKKETEVKPIKPDMGPENRKPSAIAMLEFVKKKGLYDPIHNTKMNRSCYIERCEDPSTRPLTEGKAKRKGQRNVQSNHDSESLIDAKYVCQDLEEWEKLHRKI